MRPAVFLDRDNTLIDNHGDLGDPALVRLLAGVAEGLRRLKLRGYFLAVVTNQGGVARGAFTERDVVAVHARLAALVDAGSGLPGTIDAFYYCPFHPEAVIPAYRVDAPCRKPRPGMLLDAAAEHALDLRRSWMIGDAPRDALAGLAAGCRAVMVGPRGEEAPPAALRVDDFRAAAAAILAADAGCGDA